MAQSLVHTLRSIYTKCLRQRFDHTSDTILIETNEVA